MVSITCSAGIQVTVPGEEFFTFQEMGIQNLSWASKERAQILENAYTSI
jgi:hypothetical protein